MHGVGRPVRLVRNLGLLEPGLVIKMRRPTWGVREVGHRSAGRDPGFFVVVPPLLDNFSRHARPWDLHWAAQNAAFRRLIELPQMGGFCSIGMSFLPWGNHFPGRERQPWRLEWSL